MAPGGQPRPRRPEVFTENWPETARQRVIALREKLYDLEKGYERLAQNGSKEAKKWLANLDYNCRILPMCIDAIARLEQCPEVDQIDNVLCCLERNPTEQLPEQAFTVITKIKNPRIYSGNSSVTMSDAEEDYELEYSEDDDSQPDVDLEN